MHPTAFFQTVLEASWQGSLVIVLILLLRPLLGLRIPAHWRSLLWSLALLRLLVPAFLLPASPASLQNLAVVDRPIEEAGRALERIERAPGSAALPERLPSQGPDEGEAFSPAPEPTVSVPRPWWQIAAVVWAGGSALMALWIFAGTIRLHRRLSRDSGEIVESIRRVWEQCCARVFQKTDGKEAHAKTPRRKGMRRYLPTFASWRLGESPPPRLVQTGAVSSPALVGVFRPVLLIPRNGCETLSAEDWEHIFFHELAHYRRGDHWLHALQLLALCAHWFNPLVWLGFRYLRADRELAADEWALRHLATDRPVAYGDTLLKVLTTQTPHELSPGLVGIMEDSTQMKQRLRHIVAFTPRRLASSLAGIGIVLALGALVLGRQATDLATYEGLAPAESLVIAARRGDRAAVEQLLTDGVDVNGVTSLRGERTALTAAIAAHQEEVIRQLVNKGADVNLKPEKAEAPIIVALRKGHLDTAEYLRSRGATCDAETLAAAQGDTAAVQAHLASGQPGFDKLKLLGEVAAAHNHRELFAMLFDALQQSPEKRESFPFSRSTFVNAVARGHRGIVEELLARDPNLTPSDSVNRLAAAAAQTPGMREWLISKGLKVPEYNDGERLIDAAEREDLPEIRRLLQAGVDVNYRGESEWTPLTKAAVWGCPRAVKLLLENHAEPNPPRYSYSTLELAKTPEIAKLLVAAGAKLKPEDIRYSVTFGSRELVQWFLDHGIDPTKVKGHEPTLLFSARSPEIVDLLVARGVDIHARDEEGRTALIWMLQMLPAPAKTVAALLKHGADPNARMKGGYTPLMQAEDGASVDALVAAGADLHAADDRGNGVLMSGWGAAIPSRIKALQRHGLTLDPAKGGALLISAIQLRGDLAAVKTLLALGVDPNSPQVWEGRAFGSALSAAISGGKFQIADVLRTSGANSVGPLSEATAKGDLAQMAALLDAGASADELSPQGETPLQFAVYQGQAEAAKLLLARGANVNRFTATGYTASALAQMTLASIEHGNFSSIRRLKPPEAKKAMEEIVAAIRERKPDPNYRNEAGETALMCGAGIGSMSLDLRGMDINAQRPDGMTALMLAITSQPKNAPREDPGSVGITDENRKVTQWMSARAHVVKTLLEKGADLKLRNTAGQTALDLARENGNAEILAVLQKALEKPSLPSQAPPR